jgi:hypothetical protein
MSSVEDNYLKEGLERLSKKYQSFKFEIDQNGAPVVRVGTRAFTGADSPRQALDYINSLNITNVHTFRPGQSMHMRPGSGPGFFPGLESLADELGLTIDRYSMQRGLVSRQIEEIQRVFGMGDSAVGLVFAKSDVITGLRFYRGQDEVTRSELLDLLDSKGYNLEPDGKLLKRIRAVTNEYQFAASDLRGKDRVKALFFDPTRTQEGVSMMSEYGYELEGGQYRIKTGRGVGEGLEEFEKRKAVGVLDKYRDISKIDKKLKEEIVDAWHQLKGINPSAKATADAIADFGNMKPEEIVEAGRFIESTRGVRRTMDGQIFGSAKLAETTATFLRQRAQSMEDSLAAAISDGSITEGSIDHNNILKKISKLKNNASEIDHIGINGGRFNFRAMGFDPELIGDFESYASDKIESIKKGFIGQIKGDIEIIGEKRGDKLLTNWQSAITEYLASPGSGFTVNDFGEIIHVKSGKALNIREIGILSPIDSLTMELSRSDRMNVGTSLSFERLGGGRKVFADAQALMADPELFQTEALRIKTLDYVTQQMQEVKSGAIVKEYQQYLLDKQLGYKPQAKGILANLIQLSESGDEEAARMLKLLESGVGPLENERLIGEFATALKELTSRKSGMPRILMPAVQSSHIGNTLLRSKNSVEEGYISYVKGKGFLLNNFDYDKYYDAFGGFDLDDTLRAHARWDRGSDSLIAVTKRTPGALGEIGVFKVKLEDDLTTDLLEELSNKHDSVLSHLESEKLITAKIKMKALLMQKQAGAMSGSKGLNLSQNIQAIIDSGELSGDEARLLSSRAIPDEVTTHHLLQSIQQLMEDYQPSETMEELEQQLTTAKAARKDILKGVMEKEGLALDEEAVQKLTTRSVAISDEALSGYAKYVKLGKEVEERHSSITEKLIQAINGPIDEGTKKPVTEVLDESVEALKKSLLVLEDYSNMRMIVDNLINTSRDNANIDSSKITKMIELLQQEDVIDAITKDGGKQADTIKRMTGEALDAMAEILHAGGTLDKAIMENEFGPFKLRKEWQTKLSQKLIELNPDKAFDDYFVEGQLSEFMKQAKYTEDMAKSTVINTLKEGGATKELRNHLFTLAEEKQAQELMTTFRAAYNLADQEIPDLAQVLNSFNVFGEGIEYGPQEIAAVKAARARGEVLRTLTEKYADDSGDITDEGRRVMGAFIQQHGLGTIEETIGEEKVKSKLIDHEFGSMYDTTVGWFRDLARQEGSLPGLTAQEAAAASELAQTPVNLTRMAGGEGVAATQGDRAESLTEEISRRLGDEPFGQSGYYRGRAARDLAEDVTGGLRRFGGEAGGVTKGAMKGWKNLLDVKLFRRGAVAVGGAVAFSTLYQKFKDRTPEDMEGPPLLPGGSFYEKRPGQYSQNIMNNSQSGQNGVTYKVRATGNFDVNQLSSSMQGVTGANVSSTSYQTRGYRRSDPVSEAVNRSFR